MFVGLFVVGLCALHRFGAKADMHSTLIDIAMPIMNPDYMDVQKTECRITENSSAESTLNCNIALTHTLPEDTDLSLKIVGLSMGEYTAPTGIEVHMKMCEVENEPIIMAPFFLTLFPTKTCPPEPNFYVTEGYTVPMHLLPDSFDENSYKVIFEVMHKNKHIIKVEVIAELEF